MSAQDFGEPWSSLCDNDKEGPLLIFNRHRAMIFKRLSTFCRVKQLNRAISCVNALAGVTDPAEAIRLALAALKSCQNHRYSDGMLHHQTFDSALIEQALAALTPNKE